MAATGTVKHGRLTSPSSIPVTSPGARRAGVEALRRRVEEDRDGQAAWRAFQTALQAADASFNAQLAKLLRELEANVTEADTAWEKALTHGEQAANAIITKAYAALHRQLALADAVRHSITDPAAKNYEDVTARAVNQFTTDLGTAANAYEAERAQAVSSRDLIKGEHVKDQNIDV